MVEPIVMSHLVSPTSPESFQRNLGYAERSKYYTENEMMDRIDDSREMAGFTSLIRVIVYSTFSLDTLLT